MSRVQAIIEFNLDGTIVTANENFLNALGYILEEIRGKHHSMFVDSQFASSNEYRQFWNDLGAGRTQVAEFKRIAKGGREVWIQASYNPIFDQSGKPIKVVKFAIDTTAAKLVSADNAGQLQAIGKAQAVIEFDLNGNILSANENFLNTLGYSLSEIKGKHHSMFVESAYGNSSEYRRFWDDLRTGQYQSGEFKRIGKGGKEVWIQASYNPIMDMSGRPFKVVKYASDVTAAKLQSADSKGQLDAISKAQAVIEFDLNGTIRHANDNFLNTVGYSLAEVQGKHHSLFVDPVSSSSPEYRKFWDDLKAGTFQAGQYKRAAKGGKVVWIQASYNPIYDLNGRPFKVVKYATDITAAKEMEFKIAERQKQDELSAIEVRNKVSVVLDVVNAVADGNFDINIPHLGEDPVGQVATALASAVQSVRTALIEVRDVASTVSTAAQELTGASREISTGAQSQASSLEETASSLEEITSTVKQNTDNAQQARQLANSSRDIAERGGVVVNEAVGAMEEINSSSKRIAGQKLRIWSAACSSGEEPYSIAMTLRENLPDSTDMGILASDIDTTVLDLCQQGRYLAPRVVDVPKYLLHRFFDKEQDPLGDEDAVQWRAKNLLRDLIRFRRINFQDATWPIQTKFDVIFCRNVMIYFDVETQRRLVERFANALQPEGHLIIGHSETLSGVCDRFELVGNTIYQLKPDPSAPKRAAIPHTVATSGATSHTKSAGATAASFAGHQTTRPAVPAKPKEPVVPIIVGEIHASYEPKWITTLLGSCVTACLYDERIKVGGMNHFMLPLGGADKTTCASYGVHAMEMLINALMKLGADRRRLKAKLFGGGAVIRTSDTGWNIGDSNVDFAKKFLEAECIPLVASHTGGLSAMHIRFHTRTHKALVRVLDDNTAAEVVAAEKRRPVSVPVNTNSVTLF